MSLRRFARVAAALCALSVLAAAPARAELAIAIDKSKQQMTVALNGEPLFVWPVSTGAAGYDTPSGSYTPFRMEKDHFSREWDDAPMPHSVFFTMQGHAIHGSYHVKALGTPASHGCVRLEPKNARILFDLVKQEGMKNVRVTLSGETPGSGAAQVARRGNGYDIVNEETGAIAAAPARRRIVVREYRERPPRGFYFSARPYYHRPQYGYAAPPPFFFGR